MLNVDQILLIIVSTLIGGLVSYFLKSIAQDRKIKKEIEASLKNGFDVHTKIHHKASYTDAFSVAKKEMDVKIAEYDKTVTLKFQQQKEQLDKIDKHVENIDNALTGVNINLAGINAALNLRKEHNRK